MTHQSHYRLTVTFHVFRFVWATVFLMLPPLLGWLSAEHQGKDRAISMALLAVLNIIVFAILVSWSTQDFIHSRECLSEAFAPLKEARFFALSLDMFCISDFNFYFRELNPAWEKTLGFTSEELTAKPYIEFVHPEDREATIAELQKYVAGINTTKFENRYCCKDGSYKWLEWSTAPFPTEGLVYAVARDITSTKRAEQALQESEQRFRTLFNQAAVGISQLGMDGKWLLVNQRHCDIVGYTHEEILKRSRQDITHPDDMEIEDEYFRRMLADEIATFSLEKRYIRSCGAEVWGNLTVSLVRDPAGAPKYFIGVLKDITERKRTQEALRESEQRFHALFNQAAVGIAQVGMDGRWLLVNQKFCDILGYTHKEVLKRTFWNMTYPDDLDITLDYFRRAVADEIQSYSVEKRYIHKDGFPIWVNLTVSLVQETPGEPKYFVSVVEDITERKRTEAALQESEQRFRTLFNQAGVGMSQADMDGQWLLVNQKFCDILGYTHEEVLNFTWQRLTHPDDLEADLDNVHRTVAGEIQSYCVEKRYIHKDGSSVWVNLTVSLARETSGESKYLIAVFEDISERKRVEEELAQQAKELARSNAELQQFAYVASHDLQEPLRMIASYTQLLARRYKGQLDADADEFIAYAVDGATRMQGLINDLLAYSRVGTQGEFEPTDCETVLGRAIANLRIAIQESGALITHAPLPTVMADPSQLGQLFQNLIGNAIKFHSDQPPQIHVSAQLQGQEWVFSVRDNGIGIDPEYAERIFIIFQRLHNTSEYPGSGIGLAICKKIAERHGGRIWMQSQKGEGSVFYFTIPCMEAAWHEHC